MIHIIFFLISEKLKKNTQTTEVIKVQNHPSIQITAEKVK